MRLVFIIGMLMLAKSYTKECKHIVRHHNGEQKHQGAHGGRKLMSVETEFEDAEKEFAKAKNEELNKIKE